MILIYFSGGTIGMQQGRDGLVLGKNSGKYLSSALETLRERQPSTIPDFDVYQASNLFDSSDATPADWHRIGNDILGMSAKYDGFVVLHGSDSLAWCASSLAFQLIGLDKAVVVTGAQVPLSSPDGQQALENIEGSLKFAAEPRMREVGLYFGGKLMRGCRAKKWHAQASTGFESPNWPVLGEMVDGKAAFHLSRTLYPAMLASLPELPSSHQCPVTAASRVVRISVWPGMRPDLLRSWLMDKDVDGAVIECLGGGSLPHDERLHEVLREVKHAGKVLLSVTQCPYGQIDPGTYASRRVLQDIGVVPGMDMTIEAAFSKLTYLTACFGRDAERIREFLAVSMVGEFSPSGDHKAAVQDVSERL